MRMTEAAKKTMMEIAAMYVAAGYPEIPGWCLEAEDHEDVAFRELAALELLKRLGLGGKSYRLTPYGRDWVMENRELPS